MRKEKLILFNLYLPNDTSLLLSGLTMIGHIYQIYDPPFHRLIRPNLGLPNLT